MNRVLVVGNRSLLGAGIECLLSKESDLEVFGTKYRDESSLIAEIELVSPHVIVLPDSESFFLPIGLLVRLESFNNIRIVVISDRTNRVQIYEKHSNTICQQNNLVSIVCDKHDKNHEKEPKVATFE